MTTEQNTVEIITSILDNMAAAYAGHSQYPLSHVGMALQGHRDNGGLALFPVAELAAVAAHILARRWEWDEQQRDTATAEIRQAMRQVEKQQLEHDAREARREMRRPEEFEPVDQVMETCRQVLRNLELATGLGMQDHPVLVGWALASALEDGIVSTRSEDDEYECTPEEAADFASGYLWPDRFEAGFGEEAAVIAWIAEVANTCSLNL
jgi:hypothetical protein